MSDKIKLVQNDTRPALVCALTDTNTGLPITLTGASLVLKFRAAGTTTLQATVPGVVTDALNGGCVFYPASAPEMLTGAPGDYEGEIQITFSDGQIQTVYDTLKFRVRGDF
jgi:hypothetical protein